MFVSGIDVLRREKDLFKEGWENVGLALILGHGLAFPGGSGEGPQMEEGGGNSCGGLRGQ